MCWTKWLQLPEAPRRVLRMRQKKWASGDRMPTRRDLLPKSATKLPDEAKPPAFPSILPGELSRECAG